MKDFPTIGSEVFVVKVMRDHEVWVSSMDKHVNDGISYKVLEHSTNDDSVKLDIGGNVYWWFPLEAIEENIIEVEIISVYRHNGKIYHDKTSLIYDMIDSANRDFQRADSIEQALPTYINELTRIEALCKKL